MSEVQPRLTVEIAQIFPAQGEWTEWEYFLLPDTSRIIELSDGELIMSPPATDTHQRVLDNLYTPLRSFVRENDLGILRFAPMPVRLWPGKIREPDILFVLKEHTDRVGEQFYGVPDLVVEVVSPATARTDRRDKFIEYAQAGVCEYWLVDPGKRSVEVFGMEGGVFVLHEKNGLGETARSKLLAGFEIAVDEVFAG